MPNPIFPEIIKDAINYAGMALMGMPNNQEVRTATKVLILKHIADTTTMTVEEILDLVDIEVIPSEKGETKFMVSVKPREKKK